MERNDIIFIGNIIYDRYFCKPICDELNPFENIKSQTCVQSCDIKSIVDHSCEINYFPTNDEAKEDSGKTEDEIKKQEDIKKKDIISKSITELLTSGEYNITNLEKGENEVFEINDAKFTLTTTYNQKK